jgi:uncharacterized protein (PEP-CTERM system associated)
MNGVRPTLHRASPAARFWRPGSGLAFWGFLVAIAIAAPAAAQVAEGGAQSPPSAEGGTGGAPSPGGPAATGPGLPGVVGPDVLPPPPTGGFAFPNPAAPPYSVSSQVPTLVSPPTLRLLTPGSSIVPLQAYDPSAPALLIQPNAYVSEIFTDNVNFTHSPRRFGAITNLGAGVSLSADTPRLQAVATGQINGSLYLPSTNSNLDQVFGNLYGSGLATVVPDLLFVDFQTVITQSSTLPGFGFQNLSTIPSNLQTQQYITNVSPYIRKSFDGLVDTEIRYRFGSVNYGGNTNLVVTPGVPGFTNLSSAILNEGTFIAATGEDFQQALARFTADASEYTSTSTAQNTQASAFTDLEYRFTPTIAALGRAGYQNLRYPLSPAANFAGATWLVGGRIGTVGPYQPAYFSLQYGRQQGVYGFTGAAQFNITPTMLFTASLVQGIASQGQLFQSNLANSTLSPTGAIVNQFTGLPSGFYSPGLGLSNSVFRQHLLNAGVSDSIGVNSYSLFGFYNEQQSLTPPVTAPTKSVGINFGYGRDIRPDLNGFASLGYVNSINSPTISTTLVTSTSNINTVNASLGVSYLLSRSLTGSIVYTFTYQSSGSFFVAGRNGDVFANQLQLTLSKTF